MKKKTFIKKCMAYNGNFKVDKRSATYIALVSIKLFGSYKQAQSLVSKIGFKNFFTEYIAF